MNTRFAAVAVALLLAGCASDSPPDAAPTTDATQSDAPKMAERKDKDDGRKKGKSDGESPEDASTGTQKKSTRSEDRDEGDSTGHESRSQSAAYPAAGTYTFSQSGFEEFCNTAGQCDKDKLPPRQPARITLENASEDSAVVVVEQQMSDARVTRTWTRFSPGAAHVTRAYVKFEYSGFEFERTYEPKPPVEALRFPITAGESWDGRWRAETSGSYSVRVEDRTELRIGNRTVVAYPIETTTEFRGDFEGKSRITAYVDPETKAIVATEGALNVTSQFGRYSTVFDTKLVDGPRY